LCPNCARQGQSFPNISKRNQKLVEKVVENQPVVITTVLKFQNLALQIRRPQVRILPGVPEKQKRIWYLCHILFNWRVENLAGNQRD